MEGEQLLLFPFNDHRSPKNQGIIDFDGALIEDRREQKQAQQRKEEKPIKIDSVKEAAIIAVANQYAKKADFSEIDVKTTEIILRAIADFYRKFPAVPPLAFVGDKDKAIYEARKTVAAAVFNSDPVYYRGAYYQYMADSGIIAHIAATQVRGKQIKPNVKMFVLRCTPQEAVLGVAPAFFEDGKNKTRNSVNWNPLNCQSVTGDINHELGHVLSDAINADKDREILRIYRGLAQKKQIPEELSEYAKTNRHEFIAEAWCEYTTSPKPRPVSREVGKRLEELYAIKAR